jgi:ATP-dependent DNA ligase
VRRSHHGITLNQHYEGDGATIYKHACALGCEGIVSKRLGYPYRSGWVYHWLKIKNPGAGREARGGGRLGRKAMGARAAYLT